MVSTHLKTISQDGNLPQIGVKIKNIGNHHLDHYCLIAIIITTMILFNVTHHHHHDRHDHQHHPHPSPWTLLHIINIIWSLCFSHIIDNSPFIYHQESSSITKAQSPPNLPFRPSVYPSCPYVVALIEMQSPCPMLERIPRKTATGWIEHGLPSSPGTLETVWSTMGCHGVVN